MTTRHRDPAENPRKIGTVSRGKFREIPAEREFLPIRRDFRDGKLAVP